MFLFYERKKTKMRRKDGKKKAVALRMKAKKEGERGREMMRRRRDQS